jgi:hypothetical protein
VALGLGVPRSAKTTVTSLGSLGLTGMLPAAFQRIWCPQTVCREMTANGMSLSPSSSCTVGTGWPKLSPPLVDLVTMIGGVQVDLPGGLVLVVEEVDVHLPLGGHLGILVLVTVGPAAGLLVGAAPV